MCSLLHLADALLLQLFQKPQQNTSSQSNNQKFGFAMICLLRNAHKCQNKRVLKRVLFAEMMCALLNKLEESCLGLSRPVIDYGRPNLLWILQPLPRNLWIVSGLYCKFATSDPFSCHHLKPHFVVIWLWEENSESCYSFARRFGQIHAPTLHLSTARHIDHRVYSLCARLPCPGRSTYVKKNTSSSIWF